MQLKRPLLAAKTDGEDLTKLPYPMLLSPKIDGIRALVRDGVLVSRTLKPIRNQFTQTLFGHADFEGLDGELVVGNPWDKNLMQQTSSGVMSIQGLPDVRFYVFDRWNASGGFAARLSAADDLIKAASVKNPAIELLHHVMVSNYDEVLQLEEIYLGLGYEGVMLRSMNGPYKQNRSTFREATLLKIKRFQDGEAIITGFQPLLRNVNDATVDERGYTKRSSHNANKRADDLLGSFDARCIESGQTLNIGSGFTEAQRRGFWEHRCRLLGSIVKFKHFAQTGVKDKPRIPIFLGFRDPIDL